MDSKQSEVLLDAWINMYVSIRGNRLVSVLPFNEILICNILYRNEQNNGPLLTATDICSHTKLLKSQINKLLVSLEEKEFIRRVRSEADRRKVFISLNEAKIPVYLEEHAQIIKLVEKVATSMGAEKTADLAALMHEATTIISQNS